jgi:hypothetical protein
MRREASVSCCDEVVVNSIFLLAAAAESGISGKVAAVVPVCKREKEG